MAMNVYSWHGDEEGDDRWVPPIIERAEKINKGARWARGLGFCSAIARARVRGEARGAAGIDPTGY